jgi:hypothetical protein
MEDSKTEFQLDMNHCIRLKKIYPELISGYDLVGHEDPGRTLESLTPELLVSHLLPILLLPSLS